jgi:hypothetical protein
MSRGGSYIVAALAVAFLCGAILWATRSGSTRASQAGGPDALGRDSQRFLPDAIAGVYLGMSPTDLKLARPEVELSQNANEPVYVVYDEGLSASERALYLFRSGTQKLEKVQIATRLRDVNAIAPRVVAYTKRYGDPSGVWDCPADSGHVPTRRFSWTRGSVGLMDAYFLLGDKVSATLFVAPSGVIREALATARCIPTPPERVRAFPVPPPAAKSP